MTGLLISVRDADEAEIAVAGGVDLLDVKEPNRGSLGNASPRVWQEVLRRCRGRVPLSAALGELHEAEQLADLGQLDGYDFAKAGLAGCRCDAGWPQRWHRLLRRLPGGVTPVAVVYADWRSCDAPAPRDVICAGARAGCGAVLFDTWCKAGGDLFAHLSLPELAECAADVRRFGARVVLAGSLAESSLAAAIDLQPDLIAVRGAVCRAGRQGPLDPLRVRQLRHLLDFCSAGFDTWP